MSFFEPISGADFDEKLEQARQTPGALIIDVRGTTEYERGHIPGARSVPLNQIPTLDEDRATPLFLYCHSGLRSSRACKALTQMGYATVTNLGGILDYTGMFEV